ncbi:arf-GAP with SH3 domain, ANK repeat and PH domain-containing protein 2-like [Salmo trutta]|uniref:arf-GAP with SH3 domain, ANK repeat and PH domain-containing protein 2-like n=1 Tax=Salmo trutta TaxID=8032 RepID=UPI0011303EC9|nr:arf-GAP with SH3 domain, ANK repeat and PH domain-containing protein 2-like [Salmo trutta]
MPQPISRSPPLISSHLHSGVQWGLLPLWQPPAPSAQESTAQAKVRWVQAIYDCVADHHDELTFNKGEILVVLEEDNADWC